METTNKTYSENLAELENILAQLRSDTCDIDTLSERTRRAAALLADLRNRLTITEEELNTILASFNKE